METKYLNVDKKIRLAHYSEYIPNSKIGVIVVHGLAEHKGRYVDFIEQLIQNNISVFAVDLRGHGESAGKRGDVKRFSDYLNDLHFFICDIKEKYPELKLVLFGHSLGGLISSSYVSTYGTIDLLILSSPFLNKHRKTKYFKVIPYRLCGFIKLKKEHSESKVMLEYGKSDPLSCKYYTLRLIGTIFRQGIGHIANGFDKVKLPILMLGGKEDSVVDSELFESTLEKFGSENKTLKIYDDVKHRIVQNDYKDDIIKEIIEWINKNIA